MEETEEKVQDWIFSEMCEVGQRLREKYCLDSWKDDEAERKRKTKENSQGLEVIQGGSDYVSRLGDNFQRLMVSEEAAMEDQIRALENHSQETHYKVKSDNS